jgi:hypothetical protein
MLLLGKYMLILVSTWTHIMTNYKLKKLARKRKFTRSQEKIYSLARENLLARKRKFTPSQEKIYPLTRKHLLRNALITHTASISTTGCDHADDLHDLHSVLCNTLTIAYLTITHTKYYTQSYGVNTLII